VNKESKSSIDMKEKTTIELCFFKTLFVRKIIKVNGFPINPRDMITKGK
jgi:hypothetical protein